MFECKVCHDRKDISEESRAHRTMCKQCFSLSSRYRRLQELDHHTTKQQITMKRFDDLMNHNRYYSLYVPTWYLAESTQKDCIACGCLFISQVSKQCLECVAREESYRAARQKGKVTKKVRESEDIYRSRMSSGLHVPKVFKEKGPLS